MPGTVPGSVDAGGAGCAGDGAGRAGGWFPIVPPGRSDRGELDDGAGEDGSAEVTATGRPGPPDACGELNSTTAPSAASTTTRAAAPSSAATRRGRCRNPTLDSVTGTGAKTGQGGAAGDTGTGAHRTGPGHGAIGRSDPGPRRGSTAAGQGARRP